jgi:hypothetical protein
LAGRETGVSLLRRN